MFRKEENPLPHFEVKLFFDEKEEKGRGRRIATFPQNINKKEIFENTTYSFSPFFSTLFKRETAVARFQ